MTNKRKRQRVRNGYKRNAENNRLRKQKYTSHWDFNPYDVGPFDVLSLHPPILFTLDILSSFRSRFSSIAMELAAKMKGDQK